MKKSRLSILVLFLTLLLATPAAARPELCESAIPAAARAAGVPPDILRAIALAESGRNSDGHLRPWPWAANGGGEGHWFSSRAEALAFARRMLARGEDSFDLGCFQINWRWHRQAFDSPADLLNPPTAARYAAGLLARLHAELGSWERAVGAYHSRTPARAARYGARVARLRAGLRDSPRDASRDAPPLPEPAPPDRPAPFFELLTGSAADASLVPATLSARRPFIEARP